jgi:PAS domain S-box-containing protein
MQNIDFEFIFDEFPKPLLVFSVHENVPRFLKANTAFFSQSGLNLASLHLSTDWLGALLRPEHGSNGALGPSGLAALRTFVSTHSEIDLSRKLSLPHHTEVEGIYFAIARPAVNLQNGKNPKEFAEFNLERDKELSIFFNNSIFGAFIMFADKPVVWKKDDPEVLDYLLHNLHLTRVNQAMLDQYGAKREDFIGRTPSDFFIHDVEQERELLRTIFAKGKHRAVSFERNEEGLEVIFEGDYVVLYDHQHAITGIFGVQQDITKRYRYIEKVEEQNTKLREIAWLQSHVVRAPLARLRAITNLLNTDQIGDANELKQMLEHIENAAIEVDEVISQIVRRAEGADWTAIKPS